MNTKLVAEHMHLSFVLSGHNSVSWTSTKSTNRWTNQHTCLTDAESWMWMLWRLLDSTVTQWGREAFESQFWMTGLIFARTTGLFFPLMLFFDYHANLNRRWYLLSQNNNNPSCGHTEPVFFIFSRPFLLHPVIIVTEICTALDNELTFFLLLPSLLFTVILYRMTS